jgi:hypothetical protein
MMGNGWIDNNWIESDFIDKVKQYRLAVDAYSNALERLDSADGLDREWQQIEITRKAAERARAAILQQQRKNLFAQAKSLMFDEPSDYRTEEWVLGDVGQLGG